MGPVHLAGNFLDGDDVLALGESGPKLVQEGVVAVVQIAEDGLDGLGGFVGVVKGDFAIVSS